MSLIIASVHGEVPEQLGGADVLEIRIDSLSTEDAIAQLPELLDSSSIPTIVTCRSISEGGMFDGSEEERVSVYRAALDCQNPPRYIDIEYEILSRHPLMLDALASDHTGIILSWHDMKGRPNDLLQRAKEMQDIQGVDVVKMDWRARSIRDNFEAFSLLQSRQQPMIAFCMGKYGVMSRVLAPKFGGFATYATLEGKQPTASGQLSVNELRSLYNVAAINKETKVYGVIGNSVEHSASPAFHNAAFQAANKNAVYLPLSIPAGWEHLKASVLELRETDSLHFSGASVTIPHKEHMFNLVDIADEQSTLAKATNTITIEDKMSLGNNTDIKALASLAQYAKQVLILGGGGVARAAIVAMQSVGARVYVATRRIEQAEQLAKEFSCNVACDKTCSLDTIINCTPVGMEGGSNTEDNPLSSLASWCTLDPSMLVIDTVYKPRETPLVVQAKSVGCTTITGDEMFRLQAVEQQKIWS